MIDTNILATQGPEALSKAAAWVGVTLNNPREKCFEIGALENKKMNFNYGKCASRHEGVHEEINLHQLLSSKACWNYFAWNLLNWERKRR